MQKGVEELKIDLDGSTLVAHSSEQQGEGLYEEANKGRGVTIIGNHGIHKKAVGNSM